MLPSSGRRLIRPCETILSENGALVQKEDEMCRGALVQRFQTHIDQAHTFNELQVLLNGLKTSPGRRAAARWNSVLSQVLQRNSLR